MAQALNSAADERRPKVAEVLAKFRARLLARVKSVNEMTARALVRALVRSHARVPWRWVVLRDRMFASSALGYGMAMTRAAGMPPKETRIALNLG
jgi:hypothetical protein